MSNYLFTNYSGTSSVLVRWWKSLESNKGDRAELRRCQNVTEIVATPAYHIIYRLLVKAGLPNEIANDRVPVLVALVAMVKKHVPSSEK